MPLPPALRHSLPRAKTRPPAGDPTSQLRLLRSLANDGAITLNGAQVTGTALFGNDPGGALQGPGAISSPFANAGVLLLPGPVENQGTFKTTGATVSFAGGF